MLMAEEEKESSVNKTTDGPYRFLRLALSGIAVFAAITYVLGRLHTEVYYNALGIAPGLLSFGPEDYMFSSVDLVIICAMASFYLYAYYYATMRATRTLFRVPLYPPRTKGENISNGLTIAFFLTGAIVILVALYSGTPIYVPGFVGAAIGTAVGISMIFYIWLLRRVMRRPARPLVIFVTGLLLLVLWLPSISSNLAKIEAKADIQTFPKAVIICNNALNPQLQSSSQSYNESVEVRIITTNNDMTYVLKQDVDSDERWQVYGIQNRNIETIVFTEKSG